MRYLPPGDEHQFEDFCLQFFRHVWRSRSLDRYGRRGQRQHGVDLIETAPQTSRRAVQCKHHDVRAVLTADELRAEVEKARTFPGGIDEYHVVTTSPRDTKVQLELIKINDEQRKRGSFPVTLWSWEEFELHFDADPDMAKLLPGGPVVTPATILADVAKNAIAEGVIVAGTTALDQQIDEARDLLRQGNYEAARDRLEKMRIRDWHRLDDRQRYRVLANLGSVYAVTGREHEGGTLYLQAAALQPNDPDARAFGAMGHERIGEPRQAFLIAKELVTGHRVKRAAAVYVRCAPEDEPLATLFENTKLWHGEIDVALDLISRMLNSGDCDQALELARRLESEHPAEPWGPLYAAKALILKQHAQLHVAYKGSVRELDRSALAEAETLLTTGIARCHGDKYKEAKGQGFLDRALARSSLGNDAGEQDDIEAAMRLIPEHPEVLLRRAGYFLRHDRGRGVAMLRDAVKRSGDDRSWMLLAGELAKDTATSDEAVQIYQRFADGDSIVREDALIRAVETLLRGKRFAEANALVSIQADRFSATVLRTLDAAIAFAKGARPEASRLASDALKVLQPDEPATVRRTLANVLTDLEEDDAALRIWRTLAMPGVDVADTRSLIHCAYKVGDHALVLEQCQRLRENGISSEKLIEFESSLLQFSDPVRCYEVLRDYVQTHPSDRTATLRLSMAALRIGRHDEVVTALERLPPPEGSFEAARYTLNLLMALDRYDDAIDYAYDLVRAHRENPDAHQAYFVVLVSVPDKESPERPKVEPGTAVRYSDVATSERHWLIIEDVPRSYGGPDEATPESARAAPFIGRAVGDRFVLAPGIQDREVEVLEIVTKEAHRFRETLDQFQHRFPDRHDVQAITIGPETMPLEKRFEAVLRAGDAREERVREVLEIYKSNPVPLAALSSALGLDPISCQIDLASVVGASVSATDGNQQAYEAAVRHAVSRGTLVLDVSAVATILLVGIVDQVAGLGWEVVMTFATRDAVLNFAKLTKLAAQRDGGRMGRSPGGIAFTPNNVEWKMKLATDAEKLAGMCRPIAVPALATLHPTERQQLLDIQNLSGAETVIAGAGSDRVVWSDDVTVTFLTRQHGGIAIGTQGILDAAVEKQTSTRAAADEIAAKLAAYEYQTIWLRPSVTQAACRLADHDPGKAPLSQFLRLVSDSRYELRAAAHLATIILKEIYDSVVLPERRAAFATVVLEALAARKDAILAVEVVRRALRSVLGLNVLAAADAERIIQGWMQQHRRFP